jgi:hypothetical protein
MSLGLLGVGKTTVAAGGSNPPTTNLYARWKGTNGVAVTGSDVNTWTDMQNSRVLTGSGTTKPNLSSNQIVFSNNDVLNITGVSLTSFTIYCVVTIATGTLQHSIFNDDDFNLLIYIDGLDSRKFKVEGSASVATSTGLTAGTRALVKGVATTGTNNTKSQINNLTEAQGTLASFGTITAFTVGYVLLTGGTNTMTIDEILIYNGAVTDADVKTYTTATYGIP